jgi:hypothetical protein
MVKNSDKEEETLARFVLVRWVDSKVAGAKGWRRRPT